MTQSLHNPMTQQTWSVRQAIEELRAALKAHRGFEQVTLQARLLVAATLCIELEALSACLNRVLTSDERLKILSYLQTKELIPVPLYLGYIEVLGHRFVVSHQTLMPGTETQPLVKAVVSLIKNQEMPLVVELGTGCGVVAGAVALAVPACSVFATDISEEALRIARTNVQALGINGRVNLAKISWLDPLRLAHLVNQVDVIVSNPPYVRGDDVDKLPPGFRTYAPLQAIDGGEDGLSGHRAIIKDAFRYLRTGGHLILQTDDGQAPAVAALISETGKFELPEFLLGSHGQPRIVVARRKREAHRLEVRL
jgi:release factor glutamine methyltransferase